MKARVKTIRAEKRGIAQCEGEVACVLAPCISRVRSGGARKSLTAGICFWCKIWKKGRTR